LVPLAAAALSTMAGMGEGISSSLRTCDSYTAKQTTHNVHGSNLPVLCCNMCRSMRFHCDAGFHNCGAPVPAALLSVVSERPAGIRACRGSPACSAALCCKAGRTGDPALWPPVCLCGHDHPCSTHVACGSTLRAS
jgi:hypothetical protein